MISIVRLYNSLGEKTKTSTSGYITEDSFNNNIKEVNIALLNTLVPYYSVNQYVKTIMMPFVVRSTPTNTSPDGVLTTPNDYYSYLDSSINGHPVYQRAVNEISIIRDSKIRIPSTTNNLYFCYELNGSINYLPETTLSVTLDYIKTPDIPEISLTPSSVGNEDYLTPSSITDLEWNDSAFEFILYMMLDKYGIEMKENLIMAYAKAGIQIEVNKI